MQKIVYLLLIFFLIISNCSDTKSGMTQDSAHKSGVSEYYRKKLHDKPGNVLLLRKYIQNLYKDKNYKDITLLANGRYNFIDLDDTSLIMLYKAFDIQNQIKESINLFRKIYSDSPKNITKILLASLLIKNNRSQQEPSKEILDAFKKKDTGDSEYMNEVLSLMKNIDSPENNLARPVYYTILQKTGSYFIEKGLYNESLNYLNKLPGEMKKKETNLKYLVLANYNLNHFLETIKYANFALKEKNIKNAKIFFRYLSLSYYRLKKYEKALRFLEDYYYKISNSDSEIIYAAADIYKLKKDYDKSTNYFIKYLNFNITLEERKNILKEIIKLQIMAGKKQEAKRFCSMLLEISPENLYAKGVLLELEDNLLAVKNRYEKIFAEEPENIKSIINLALVQYKNKEYRETIKLLKKLKQQNYNYPDELKKIISDAYYRIALDEKNIETARRYVMNSLLFDNTNYQANLLLAELLIKKNQNKQFELLINKMIAENPEKAEPYLYKTRYYLNSRQEAKARETLYRGFISSYSFNSDAALKFVDYFVKLKDFMPVKLISLDIIQNSSNLKNKTSISEKYLEFLNKYRRTGNISEKIYILENIIKTDKNNTDAGLSLIRNYNYNKDYLKLIDYAKIFYKKLYRNTEFLKIVSIAAKEVKDNSFYIKVLEDWLSINKNDIYLNRELGKYYLDTGKYKKALISFERIEHLNNPDDIIDMGRIYCYLENYDMAIKKYEKAENLKEVNSARLYFYKGQLYNNNDLFDQALKYFNISKKSDDYKIESLLKISDIFFKQNKIDTAITILKNLYKTNKDNSKIQEKLTYFLKKKGDKYLETDKTQALNLYFQVYKIKPDIKGLLNNISIIYSSKGNYKRAISILKENLKYNNNDETTLLKMAECYYDMNDRNRARDIFLEVLSINPASYSAKAGLREIGMENLTHDSALISRLNDINLKLNSLSEKTPEQRIKDLKLIIENQPHNYKAYYAVSLLYIKNKDYKSALEYLNSYLAEIPNDANAMYLAGQIYFDIKNPVKALKIFEKLYRLKPSWFNSIKGLTEAYIKNGMLDKAEETLNKTESIKLSFNQKKIIANLYYETAKAYLNQGKYKQAEKLIEISGKNDGNNPEIMLTKGKLLLKNNDVTDTEKYYWQVYYKFNNISSYIDELCYILTEKKQFDLIEFIYKIKKRDNTDITPVKAYSLYNSGNYSEVIGLKTGNLKEKDAELVNYYKGLSYFELAEYNFAIKFLIPLIHNPDYKEKALFKLALIEYNSENIDTSLKYSLKCSKINPENFKNNYLTANIFFKKEDYDKAKKYYLKIPEIAEPEILISVYNNLGIIFLKEKKYKDAFDYFEKSLFLNKTDKKILFNKALTLKQLHKPNLSLKICNDLLNNGYKNEAELFALLGIVYFDLGKYVPSTFYIEESLKKNKNQPDLRKTLEIIKLKTGQR